MDPNERPVNVAERRENPDDSNASYGKDGSDSTAQRQRLEKQGGDYCHDLMNSMAYTKAPYAWYSWRLEVDECENGPLAHCPSKPTPACRICLDHDGVQAEVGDGLYPR